jgi:hypothetical protein
VAFIPVAEAKPVAAPLFKSPTNSAGHVVSYRPLELARVIAVFPRAHFLQITFLILRSSKPSS